MEETKEITHTISRIEVNPGDALLVQIPRDHYRTDVEKETLRRHLKALAEGMKVRVFVLLDDLRVTVIGPAAAHELAEHATLFERAIEEIPP